jgi:hypothetical protein
MSRRTATKRSAISVGLLAIALLVVGSSPAWARGSGSVVRFHGYRLTVPSAWSVYDLARTPSTCVRFNRHALYLGIPSANQRCPAHAVGRTEAILVEPVSAGEAATASARGALVRGPGWVASFIVPSAGLLVTATWSRDRALVAKILGRRVNGFASSSASRARARASARLPLTRSTASATPMEATYSGLGFDACTAPSTTAMSAWSSSPFRAVGVYIGGANAACSQPNLTASWVSAEVAAGWHLIPTYVGLQGAGACSCYAITPSDATAEGAAAASDAVNQAQALGIPAGNPIYDDMEQYSSSDSAAVLAFLAGWTSQLHAKGYLSGVYSSASSGITALVDANGTGYAEPDDIWIADWNDEQTTSDPYVPTSDWSINQRLHQYVGGHNDTYGGVTINIDTDYLDGATADTSSPIPDNTFVQVAGLPAVYRITGGAPLYVSSWTGFGGEQPVDVITPQQFSALPQYPANGTFLTTTTGLTYRVAGGAPIEVTNWGIFGAPQPSETVDEWDLQNISNPLAHLEPAPVNGTVVEGLPSGSYWSFCDGVRSSAATTPGAVGVDDQGLAAFPVAPLTGGVGSGCGTPTPQPRTKVTVKCVVPRLKHMTLDHTRAALRRAHCSLGKVRRPRHWGRHHVLRVFGQSATPRSKHRLRYKVNIRLI